MHVRTNTKPALAGLVGTLLVLTGCGTAPAPTGNVADGKARVTMAHFDVTAFVRFAKQFEPDVVTVAQQDAAEKPPGKFIFATIDCKPLSDANFVTVDFAQHPAGANLDPD